jgi:hypothetical protein
MTKLILLIKVSNISTNFGFSLDKPNQGNASIYFNAPDGNSLELMYFIEVPSELKHIGEKLSIEDWENLISSYRGG